MKRPRLSFGDDIFISYARKDSSTYASGLAAALAGHGFSCFIDKLRTEASPDPPPSLLRKVRSCSMLVVVGTKWSGTRESIQKEVSEFKRTRRTMIPVDVDGSIYDSIWYVDIEGIEPERERNPQALDDGKPSPNVVARIEQAFKYSRRNQRLRRWTMAFTSLLLILIVASGIAAYIAQSQIAEANQARTRADSARGEAIQAKADRDNARDEATQASADRDRARGEAAEANADRDKAHDAAAEANADRDRAEKDSKRQEAIAEARRLANRSAELVSSDIVKSVDYAAQSVRKVDSRAVQLYDASQALRDSVWLLPRQGELREVPGDESVLSDSGKYVAVATRDDANFTRTLIRVFQADELKKSFSGDSSPIKPKHQFSFDTDEQGSLSRFSISADARRAAAVVESDNKFGFVVKDLEGRAVLDSRTFPSYQQDLTIRSIALSPNGDFLALAVIDSKETKPGAEQFLLPKTIDSVLLVDLATKKVSRICSMQDTDLRNLSFAEGGKSLIGVGGSTRGEGMSAYLTELYRVSNVLIWRFPDGSPAKSMESDPIDPDLYPFEYAKNAAISDDGTLLAVTQSLGTMTIYELENQRPVARFPSLAFAQQLRFSNDGRTLVTLFGDTYSTWDVRGYTAQLESVDWNADLAKQFEPPGQKFFAVFQDGVISSVTESSTRKGLPLAPQLLLAPRLPKDADLEDHDQFNFDRSSDQFKITLTPDGNMLAALVENPGRGFQIQLYKRKPDGYVPHASSPSGNAAVSRVFQTPSLPGFQRNEDPYRQIAISPNGKYVACNCEPGKSPAIAGAKRALCIWDVDRDRWLNKRIETNQSSPMRFKFSSKGTYLAVFGSGQDLVLFNVQNNSEQRFKGTDNTHFDDLNFDAEEKLIGAATTDNEVEVLNTRDLSRVAHLPLRKNIGEIAFSRDGKSLLTLSYQDRVANSYRWEVWDLVDDRLISQACARMRATLFQSETHACK